MNKMTKVLLMVLFIAGAAAALGKVFFWGESVTNYGAYTPWGLWVGLYIFLVGTAAGSAWMGLYSAYHNGGNPNRLTSISFIIAAACLAFGLAFIGSDLGKPMKGISIFLNPSFSSKLAWASWIYAAFFVCVAGYFLTNAKKAFMYAAGVAAVAFLTAEGMFFGGMVARSLWHSWLTPLSFFTAAVACGSAMVYGIGLLSQKQVVAEEGTAVSKVVLPALAAHVVVEAIHIATALGGSVEKAALVKSMVAAPAFWGIFAIVGVIIPVMLIMKSTNRMNILPLALVLLGMAAYKYSFVRYGFSVEPLPGLAASFYDTRLSLAYTPSVVEWVIAVGFLAGVVWVADWAIAKLQAKLA